jgi:hypothetical protein
MPNRAAIASTWAAPRFVCFGSRSGRELRFWRDELLSMRRSPFDVEKDIFVGFYASAEIGCFLQLGWPLPLNVVDLYVEHRVLTNGLLLKRTRQKTTSQSGKTLKGNGRDSLLNALAIRGLGHMDVDAKDAARNLILMEPNPSPAQRSEIVDYCAAE